MEYFEGSNSRTWSRLNAASQDFRKENGNVQYYFELEWIFRRISKATDWKMQKAVWLKLKLTL